MKYLIIIIIVFTEFKSAAQYTEFNLDFESKNNLNLPNCWGKNESGIEFYLDSINVFHGNYSLSTEISGKASYAQIFQSISNKNFHFIEFNGYVKGDGYLAINIDGKVFKSKSTETINGFNFHKIAIPVNERSKKIYILCISKSISTFDNLNIMIDNVEYGKSANELLTTDKEVIKNNSIPFTINDSTFAEMTDLKPIKLFGIGEGTHGTKEFKQSQFQLSQYLIEKHTINNILIECNYFEIKALNEYLLIDSIQEIKIDELTYWIYKNEEFILFLKWIKQYNTNNLNKVQLIGYDIMIQNDSSNQTVNYFKSIGQFEVAEEFNALIQELPDISEIQSGKIKRTTKYLKKLIKLEKKLNLITSDEINQNIWMLKQYCRIIANPSPNTRANLLLENISFFAKGGKKQIVLAHNSHISEMKIKFQGEAITFCSLAGKGKYMAKDDNNKLVEYSMQLPYVGTLEYYLDREIITPVIIANNAEIRRIAAEMSTRNIGSVKPEHEFILNSDNLGINDYLIYFPETTVCKTF